MKFKILYVEDDKEQRKLVTDLLRDYGYYVIDVSNPLEALQIIKKHQIELIISDYRMPDMNGYELMEKVKDVNPLISFIMVTAYGDIELAVRTIKSGAVDFITKPFNFDDLLKKVKIIERESANEEQIQKIEYQKDLYHSEEFEGIIGKSRAFKSILSKIPRIAITKASVLIIGESGTGKEIIADLIQSLSDRKEQPFIKVNCAAIPDSLIESELFGYEKGAFTGADKGRKGLIEEADRGTLFLDEIGEIPYSLQSKLLRFLQNYEIQKIGTKKTKKVDIRVIAATNRNLERQVKDGKFREDLYYRLNVVSLNIPPLRERKEDIPLLINYFIKDYIKSLKISEEKKLSKSALDKLMKYDYPGNIRELNNIIKNSIIMSLSNIIEPEDIPIVNNDNDHVNHNDLPDTVDDMNEYISQVEKHLIEKALDRNEGNMSQAAKELKITLRILRYKIKKYNIKI